MTRDPKHWIVTASGKRFWPLAAEPEDVCIEDIAHALANVCRFAGHCSVFYSVAQHSIHVSHLVPAEDALAGLLHDATEAYIGDMCRPLKALMPEYQEAEQRLWNVIADRFGLNRVMPLMVKAADDIALATERRDLVVKPFNHEWSFIPKGIAPDDVRIVPIQPGLAREAFLARFSYLIKTKGN